MHVYHKIKKYLLYLAVFFFVALLGHLVFLYVHHDASEYAVEGGTVRVGMVHPGGAPSIDLLSYDSKSSGKSFNDLLIRFLYRGMLTYSLEDEKIIEDLGNCGIDTFPRFTCTMNSNALWDDRTPIEIADVIATYDFYKSFSRNPGFKSRLEKLEVTEKNGAVEFFFTTSDITTLDLLFLPILRQSDIERFEQGFSFDQHSFSGPYVFESRGPDVETGQPQIVLSRNVEFAGSFINGYVFRFYEDQDAMIDDEENLDLLLPSEKRIEKLSNEWTEEAYLRPQYFAAFLNSERLEEDLRRALFSEAFSDELISESDEYVLVPDVFFGSVTGSETETKTTFAEYLKDEGYVLGRELIESNAKPDDSTPLITPEAKLPESKYIFAPSKTLPIFSSSEPIELKGNVPSGTTRVVINDYTLQFFKAGNESFWYKASTGFNNLSEGKNEYKIQFYKGSELADEEVIEVYYSENTETLETYREQNTPSETPETPEVEDAPETADQLNPNTYYNSAFEPFTLKILYLESSVFLSEYAKNLAKRLNSLGIRVVLKPLSSGGLQEAIGSEQREYDILLSGIYLGIFEYNIFPYFHSGQAKSGSNLTGVRIQPLDGLLEQLREGVYYSSPTRLATIKTDILKVLDAQFIVHTLVNPYEYMYIRKDEVKNLNIPEKMPSLEYIRDVFQQGFIKNGVAVDLENKSFSGFFGWIGDQF